MTSPGFKIGDAVTLKQDLDNKYKKGHRLNVTNINSWTGCESKIRVYVNCPNISWLDAAWFNEYQPSSNP